MLDLETWGTTPYSTIIMIGACEFDPYAELEKDIIKDRFEVAIEPDSRLRMDTKTLIWWMNTERDTARTIWLGTSKVSLDEALDGFADWLRSLDADPSDLRIWGNGAGFDNTLLRQAYDVLNREAPWSFRHDRCFRTLRAMLTFEEGQYLGTQHTALADAENQAIRAAQIVQRLGIKLT